MKILNNLPDWPKDETEKSLINEYKKMCYQASLDSALERWKADLVSLEAQRAEEEAADLEVKQAVRNNEFILNQAVHNAYLEVAKGEIGRITTRAEFVQKAAAAIGTIYVAVIGLTFGTGTDTTTLSWQGIAPTIFLGLAIFLSTAYIAYVTQPRDIEEPESTGNLTSDQKQRLYTFIKWARSPGLRRIYLLQASIVSLGLGIVFLPAAYLSMSKLWAIGVILGGILTTFLLPLVIYWIDAHMVAPGEHR